MGTITHDSFLLIPLLTLILVRLFSPLLSAVRGLAIHGLVRPNQLQIPFVTTDLKTAMDYIENSITNTAKSAHAEQEHRFTKPEKQNPL